MFDKCRFNTTRREFTSSHSDVNITENRAPTDESVRLLSEFREKARMSLFDTMEVRNNILNGVLFCYIDDVTYDKLRYIAKFKINNNEFVIRGETDKSAYEKFAHLDVMGRFISFPNVMDELTNQIKLNLISTYAKQTKQL